jgi:hypothetical protein
MSLSPMIGISNQLVNWKCFSSSYSPVPFPLLLFFVDGLTSQNLALLLTHLDPKVLSGLPQTLLYQCADTAFSSLPSLLMETYVWAGGNPVTLHFRAFGYFSKMEYKHNMWHDLPPTVSLSFFFLPAANYIWQQSCFDNGHDGKVLE